MKGGGRGEWVWRRKKRVSEPAPREMICFWGDGDEEDDEEEKRKRWTRVSIALVRT